MGAGRALRGDVQGLRAVAVLVVVAAHAGVGFVPGGFVGVDVFFVISGYLICGLLLRDVATHGQVSLTRFWSRRARRILPAATLVTLAAVLLSVVVLPLLDARAVVGDAIWSSLFAANVHFAAQDLSYFADTTGTSPLQHYWSLAVEEQFYVVWPVLLAGFLALPRLVGRRWRSRPVPTEAVLTLLVVLTATSFGWSVAQTAHEPTTAYFSTLTRAWELGVGAIAAVLAPTLAHRLGQRAASTLALSGLYAVLVACLLLSPAVAFPGYAAALPVLGTAAVLLAGAGPATPITSLLLDNRPMRAIGDWSYAIYLWHWPMLVLPRWGSAEPLGAAATLLAVLVTLVLAVLTHRYVEQPFRTGRAAQRIRPRRTLLLYPLSLALVAVACLGAWSWTSYRGGERGDNPPVAREPARALGRAQTVALVRRSVEAARRDVPVPSDLTPDLLDLRESVADVGSCDYGADVRSLCPRGDPDGERTLVVVGDSHGRAWIPAFEEIAGAGGWRAYYLVKPQCTAAHVTVAPTRDERPFTACDEFHDWVSEQVRDLRPDLVVVASAPPVNGVFDDSSDGRRHEGLRQMVPLLSAGYDDLFADLTGAADRTVLLRDVPKNPDDPGTCLGDGRAGLRACLFRPVERSVLLADVAAAAARRAGVRVVDPTPWLCYDGECPVVIGGTLSYRDSDHLTTEYAAALGETLGRALHMLGAPGSTG